MCSCPRHTEHVVPPSSGCISCCIVFNSIHGRHGLYHISSLQSYGNASFEIANPAIIVATPSFLKAYYRLFSRFETFLSCK